MYKDLYTHVCTLIRFVYCFPIICIYILSHNILHYIHMYATARPRVHDRADAQPGPGQGRALAGPVDCGKNTIYIYTR